MDYGQLLLGSFVLREQLDIGLTLRRVFAAYLRHLGLLLGAAVIVFLLVDLLNGLVLSSGGSVIWEGLAAIIAVIGTYWYQGFVVETIYESQASASQLSLAHLFKVVWPRLAPLVAVGVLGGIAIVIGFILLIVPGLVLATWWALLAPVIVVEHGRWFDAFGRSRALVRGSGWQVFAVVVIVFLLQIGVAAALQAIGGSTLVGQWLANLVANVFTAPIVALAAAIMYFELRGAPQASQSASVQQT